jgi:hypothetical protein
VNKPAPSGLVLVVWLAGLAAVGALGFWAVKKLR